MKHKILILLLVLILSVLPNTISISKEVTAISMDDYSGISGEEISVDIRLSANSNVCVGTFYITYDSNSLELIACEAGDVIAKAMPQFNENYKSDTIKATFMTTTSIVEEGVLCKLKFKIIATEGEAEVKVNNIEFYDFDENTISVESLNGVVAIKSKTNEESTMDSDVGSVPSTSGIRRYTQTPNAQEKDLDTQQQQQITISFSDISEYPWALTEIEYLVEKGIIRGTSQTTFSPSLPITRADFMVLLIRMLGIQEDITDNFVDVKEDAYYYYEIGAAKKMGYISGIGNNIFNPEEPITRQDMFSITYRIIKDNILDDEDLAPLYKYNDNLLIADYAKQPIAVLIKNDLIKGNNNMINPVQNATRAETAVFIYRLYSML
ncbi:MAG: hypothetical protein GX800_07860 [Clostridiaceae bacterium]|nr:hypothetical protein [Clostridiaceae bacterium]